MLVTSELSGRSTISLTPTAERGVRRKRGWPTRWSTFRGLRVERSSGAVTCRPRASSASARWEPMTPAPPVTRALGVSAPARIPLTRDPQPRLEADRRLVAEHAAGPLQGGQRVADVPLPGRALGPPQWPAGRRPDPPG